MKQDKNIGKQIILQPFPNSIEKIKNASAQYEALLVEKPLYNYKTYIHRLTSANPEDWNKTEVDIIATYNLDLQTIH